MIAMRSVRPATDALAQREGSAVHFTLVPGLRELAVAGWVLCSPDRAFNGGQPLAATACNAELDAGETKDSNVRHVRVVPS